MFNFWIGLLIMLNIVESFLCALRGDASGTVVCFMWALLLLIGFYIINKKDIDEWRRKKIEGE